MDNERAAQEPEALQQAGNKEAVNGSHRCPNCSLEEDRDLIAVFIP